MRRERVLARATRQVPCLHNTAATFADDVDRPARCVEASCRGTLARRIARPRAVPLNAGYTQRGSLTLQSAALHKGTRASNQKHARENFDRAHVLEDCHNDAANLSHAAVAHVHACATLSKRTLIVRSAEPDASTLRYVWFHAKHSTLSVWLPALKPSALLLLPFLPDFFFRFPARPPNTSAGLSTSRTSRSQTSISGSKVLTAAKLPVVPGSAPQTRSLSASSEQWWRSSERAAPRGRHTLHTCKRARTPSRCAHSVD